jgi:glutamate synthase domain-containing protein 3
MTDGTLLVFGKAGAMLGQDMTGGTIYVAGEVESMAPQIEVVRLRESDRLRIGLLLLKSGLKAEARDFRVLKVAGT